MNIGSRLMLARKRKQMSMRALAALADVSAMAISKFEKGDAVPRPSTLRRLAKALEVKTEFFLRESTVDQVVPAYRKKSRLGVREQGAIEANIVEAMERYLQIEEIWSVQRRLDYGLPSFGGEVTSDAEQTADALRAAWFLGNDPIDSVCGTLESRGVRLVMLGGSDRFNGLSCWVNGNVPVIAYNAHLPGDRQRFTLAHELGHLILKSSEEVLAHRFAGAFLAPKRSVFEELGRKRTSLDLQELILLKRKYGMSIQAWVMRAYQLGIITEAARQRFFRQIAMQGMRKQEPGVVPKEQPERMDLLVHQALAEKLISPPTASSLLGRQLKSNKQVLSEELEKAAELLAEEYLVDSELREFTEADLGDLQDDFYQKPETDKP